MSGGQAEGREEAQTSLCCGRTALAEDCMEKNPEVWEDLVYTRLSPDNSLHCTNFEGEAVLKPAISSPSLAAEFALKQNQSKTKALALVLLNQQCQKPLSSNAGPSNSRAQLPPHRLSLCGACPVWSRACLTASTSLSPAGSSGGRPQNQQLQAKLCRQEGKPGLWSSLVWHWHPPKGPSCLQKCWEILTQFADDLCSAVYFKHKQLPLINKQDLNTLET